MLSEDSYGGSLGSRGTVGLGGIQAGAIGSLVSILLSKGHRIQRERIRNSVKAVDSDGVLFLEFFLTANIIHRIILQCACT